MLAVGLRRRPGLGRDLVLFGGRRARLLALSLFSQSRLLCGCLGRCLGRDLGLAGRLGLRLLAPHLVSHPGLLRDSRLLGSLGLRLSLLSPSLIGQPSLLSLTRLVGGASLSQSLSLGLSLGLEQGLGLLSTSLVRQPGLIG